jgi:hypothetical protein
MKKLAILMLLVSLSLIVIPTVFAKVNSSIIVITPQWPLTQNTPATFNISTTPASDPTYAPHILLVMTVACYNGLTNVEVSWTGGSVTFAKSDFTLISGSPPPKIPADSISEKQYTRSSLADHLGLPGESSVYWAMKPFLGGSALHTTPQQFTVTLHSTNPKMLVYALGKACASDTKLNRWVPPTNPGFVVPELGTILLAMGSFGALALFSVKRRKVPQLK